MVFWKFIDNIVAILRELIFKKYTYLVLIINLIGLNYSSFSQSESCFNEASGYLYANDQNSFNQKVNGQNNSETIAFAIAYNYFWQGLIQSDFETYFPLTEKQLTKYKPFENEHLEALSNLLQLRIEFSQNNYLAAYGYSAKLKQYFKQNANEKSNGLNSLLWGVYHYFIASARESFFYRTMLVGWPEATKSKGLNILKELSKHQSIFLATESTYLLGKIYLEIEELPELAHPRFNKLVQQYPNNKVFAELLKKANKQLQKEIAITN